ncbi:hypothetical protein [Nocardia pseudobrasiliensis]|uniref:Uncharacterized protein n=1 Tax=Nocardia pseudobrasiliensis TaxID=45979 RepID=A0A370I886_9NOCA|nr:hypothetical protein [Nocardia pseudobrasiliensis]RDI66946.1 hypothetical protein DFR76_10317 [Nocardia pseudobrasiliensis]
MITTSRSMRATTALRLTKAYMLLSAATVLAVLVLTVLVPTQVTPQVWVRSIIVAITSVLTYLFARRAERGEPRALLRLQIIIVVLLVAFTAVLLFLPLPLWMVVEQAICLILLAIIAALIFRPTSPTNR